MPDSQKLDIAYTLFRSHLFFDYANRFRRLHDTIPAPRDFCVTDDMLNDFLDFLDERRFVYETETSRYFKEMMEMAREEDIDSLTLQLMDTLQLRLQPSFREAVMRNKQSVKRLLGAEIVTRYYFQEGRVTYLLKDDEDLRRAMEEIRRN